MHGVRGADGNIAQAMTPETREHGVRRIPALRQALALLACTVAFSMAAAQGDRSEAEAPKVTPPPEAFFQKFRERDRDAARAFYKKHLDVRGLSVAAAAEVADEALLRTHEIVSRMLAGRR